MQQIIKEIFESNNFIDENEFFLSEKDLQFSLALMLKKEFTDVILEYPITKQIEQKNQYKYIDIYCKNNKKNKEDKTEYFIELKYKTKECKKVKRFGINDLVLHDHGAYYDNRFYVYRDIEKLEKFISNRENCKRYVIFLTNDEKYQSKRNASFPLYNRIEAGQYCHRSCESIVINNNYDIKWEDFTKNKNFKYLVIEIPNKKGEKV